MTVKRKRPKTGTGAPRSVGTIVIYRVKRGWTWTHVGGNHEPDYGTREIFKVGTRGEMDAIRRVRRSIKNARRTIGRAPVSVRWPK